MSPRTTPLIVAALTFVAVSAGAVGCEAGTAATTPVAPPGPQTPPPAVDATPSPGPGPSPNPGQRPPSRTEAASLRCTSAGCSGELCVNAADPHAARISTCIYEPKFACYMEATCERQADGQCGWTVTPELDACLADARSMPSPVPAPQIK